MHICFHHSIPYASIIGRFLGMMLLVGLTACSNDATAPPAPATIYGSGNIISEMRELPVFTSVRVEMTATVIVGLADSQSAEVSVDDNVMEYVETLVDGSTLVIRLSDDVDLSGYNLDIAVLATDLNTLACPGTATIRSSSEIELDALRVTIEGVGTVVLDLDVDQLESLVSGFGTLDYAGTAAQHLISISGTGTVSAYRLASAACNVTIGGSGTVLVTVIDDLDVTIGGSGTVFYKGNPEITQLIEGSGQIINAN
ncbi:MAG: head GIN domain-containing protein [Candidatus Zixiibacteriota bacterium]